MEKEYDDSETRKDNKCARYVRSNLLIIFMVASAAIGIGMGFGLRDHWDYTDKRKIHFLRFPGDLLMNMLKMMILPLVVSSIISALASLDIRSSGRMGGTAIIYYLTTTLIAVIIGIILVLSIQPGNIGDEDIARSGKEKTTNPADAMMDLIRNCFPPNLIAACFQKQETEVTTEPIPVTATTTVSLVNITTTVAAVVSGSPMTTQEMTTEAPEMMEIPKVKTTGGTNVLGLVVFSIFFGIIIGRMEEEGRPLRQFFQSFAAAISKLVSLVIWFAPIGIMFLIATKIIEMKDPTKTFTQLGYYMATVLAGLAVHAFIILPLLYFIFVRRNPYIYMYNMLKALVTAWATASSSATLPVTMRCLEDNNNIDPRVTKMIAPIGATINMDGTALYEAVASIFIAQYNNITLDVGQVIIVSLTSTAAAIGAAGIPEAGLVTMTIVLTAVGLPVEDVTLILAIDWFLDRCRTAVNVLGDAYGAGIVSRFVRDNLARLDEEATSLQGDQFIPMDGVKHPTNGIDNKAYKRDRKDPAEYTSL